MRWVSIISGLLLALAASALRTNSPRPSPKGEGEKKNPKNEYGRGRTPRLYSFFGRTINKVMNRTAIGILGIGLIAVSGRWKSNKQP